MNYLFSKLFIGTLAENQKDGTYYQGEILCTMLEGDTVVDVINGHFYEHLGHENRHLAAYGETFVIGLHEHFPKHLGNNIFRKNTLLQVASELNKEWTSINIPRAEVKVKKRK